MKPTGRDTRLWPDDAAGLRALVSVRWRGLIGTPARRPRVPLPADRNGAVRALFAQTMYGTRRAGHAGVDMPAPGGPAVLRTHAPPEALPLEVSERGDARPLDEAA